RGARYKRGCIIGSNTNSVSAPIVLRTNGLGQAGVVVTASLSPPNPNSCVDVKAENLGTAVGGNPAIKVFQQVTPATGAVGCAGIGGTTPTTPASPASPASPTSNTTTSTPNTVTAPVTTSVTSATTSGVEASTTIVTLN